MKLKKILSVFLAVIMAFSVTTVAFAADETDDATFNMYLIPTGSVQVCRGESVRVDAIYHYEKYDNISLVWSTEGDACIVKYITDKKSGVVTGVKVKSVGEDSFTVKVDMVSENGEIIQSAEKTIENVSLKERLEYEKASSAFGFMFIIFLILDFIIIPVDWLFGLIK